MPNKRPTQVTRIAKYIEDFGSITQLQALADIGVMRLPARIAEMRSAGYPIKTEMIPFTNRYGEKGHIAKYSFIEEM
ncbi:MAG: helix-turn-helix domain-containing protein [Clostridia bacterium]|nr:helix-turn-helix domain-containing protein [Clostridia bacterium]